MSRMSRNTTWLGAPGRNRTCDSRFRKSIQPRLPTCENTLKGASDQAIPSLEHPSLPDVSRSFAGPPRGQSVDDVIQDQRHNVSEEVRPDSPRGVLFSRTHRRIFNIVPGQVNGNCAVWWQVVMEEAPDGDGDGLEGLSLSQRPSYLTRGGIGDCTIMYRAGHP
jgi:hypothetical protein